MKEGTEVAMVQFIEFRQICRCTASLRMLRVGVVGAGLSGLTAASRLLALLGPERVQISLIEWGRGPGGRTARRRAQLSSGREASWDHAAPWLAVGCSERFAGWLGQWEARGLVARWQPRGGAAERWVGCPSNHAVAKAISVEIVQSGGSVLYGTQAVSAEYSPDRSEWRLELKDRATGQSEQRRLDVLILTDKLLVIPNQYCVLRQPGALEIPDRLRSDETIVLLLALGPGCEWPTVELYELPGHSMLRLVVCEGSKPGRGGLPGLWVAHSSREYAREHLEGEAVARPEQVACELTAAVLELLGAPEAEVVYASAFGWDHAQPSADSRMPGECLFDPQRRAGLCGDFFFDGEGPSGVEAAVLSGASLAEHIASHALDSQQAMSSM